MPDVKRLIHEIHRRSLWQVLGIYVVGSWLAFQAVQTFTEGLGLPDWVPPLGFVLLIIGLPIVVATAFVQEGLGTREGRSEARLASEHSSQEGERADEASKHIRESPPLRIAVSSPAGVQHRVFTWRNATVGGVVGFALLGLATAAYMAMRTLGIGPAATLVAQGTIEESERIVLADFDDAAGDQALADAVTELIRTDLEQTRSIRLLDPLQVQSVLERMERPSDTRVTPEIAREVAKREGIKAVLVGELSAVGGARVVSARLLSVGEDETLLSLRETADDSTGVIDAVERLSRRIRERTGESLRTIRASPPLGRATTSSLAALKLYTEGMRLVREGRRRQSLDVLRQAVQADSMFAEALIRLSIELANLDIGREEGIAASTRAFELRDRLPDARRYYVEGVYHLARREPQLTLQSLRSALVMDSTNSSALNNVGWMLRWMRNDEEALEYFERALRTDTLSLLGHAQVVRALQTLGRRGESDSVLAIFERRFPGHPASRSERLRSFLVWGDDERAEVMATENESNAPRTLRALRDLHGRFAENLAGSAGTNGAIRDAKLTALFRPSEGPAVAARIDSLIEADLEELPQLERPLLTLAIALAGLGLPDRARELVQAFDEAIPEGFVGEDIVDRHRADGAIAMAEGRLDDAIASFREANVGSCTLCALTDLARAYDAASQPDSAIAVYERFIDTISPRVYRFWWLDRPLALERLGQLFDERGNLESASKYYAMFVELWAEADEELQPRVQAAQRRLEEILAERG